MKAQPKAAGNYKLVANASVVYLPTYREVIKAAAWLSPDTLCDVFRPDGSPCFKRAAAREVTGLGRGTIGIHMRQKAQNRRSR